MPRSRRSTLLLSVAVLALPVALSACSTPGPGAFEFGNRSPSGGTMEPVADAARVDAGRLTRIAQATEAAGDLNNAVAMYQRAVVLDPESIGALLGLANIYRRIGAPENAAYSYRAVLSRLPDNLEARRGLGNALIALDKPGEAIAEFDRLIAADPLDSRGYNGRGVALATAGRHQEARESFATGLKLAPDDVQHNNNLAFSLAMSGLPAEAVPILKRLSALPNAPERVRENLAMAEQGVADAVRVSGLGPPSSAQGVPSDVLYQAPQTTMAPLQPVTGTPESAPAPKSAGPVALSPEAPRETKVRQASRLIEELEQSPSSERADAREIPAAAAEPAAGAIEPDASSGLVVIRAPALEMQRVVPTPHPSATAPIDVDTSAAIPAPPRSTIAKSAPLAGPWGVSERATGIKTATAAVTPPIASPAMARMATIKEQRNGPQAATPFPSIAPSSGGNAIPTARDAIGQTDKVATEAPGGVVRYRVQLSAEASKELARATWQEISEIAPDLMRGLTPFISATTSTEGTRYRLRTNVMKEASAKTLCHALTAREIACYVAAVGGVKASTGEASSQIAPKVSGTTDAQAPAPPSAAQGPRPWPNL